MIKYFTITASFFVFFVIMSNLILAYTGHRETEKSQIDGDATPATNKLKDIQNEAGATHDNQYDGHTYNRGIDEQDTAFDEWIEGVDTTEDSVLEKVIKWIGNFHTIAIHFPIALLVMTGFSELLGRWTSSPIFYHSSRFMIISAAITAIPAALLGLAYGYDVTYSDSLTPIFWWHRFWGIITPLLAIIAALLKELYIRKKTDAIGYGYYISLIMAILFVTITGYLGGGMTFGFDFSNF